ncbi:Nucleoside diphosphate kinase, partial [Musa troglodytarum]
SGYNCFAFCLGVCLVRLLFAASVRKEGRRSVSEMEQTFVMIKPDGVQRGLVGEIIGRFEKKGFYLKGLKMVSVERSFAEKHYADLSAKPFFAGLVEYIISGPVVAMVWEGKSVVVTGRKIIGATNPADSAPGTIRGDLAIEIG